MFRSPSAVDTLEKTPDPIQGNDDDDDSLGCETFIEIQCFTHSSNFQVSCPISTNTGLLQQQAM